MTIVSVNDLGGWTYSTVGTAYKAFYMEYEGAFHVIIQKIIIIWCSIFKNRMREYFCVVWTRSDRGIMSPLKFPTLGTRWCYIVLT